MPAEDDIDIKDIDQFAADHNMPKGRTSNTLEGRLRATGHYDELMAKMHAARAQGHRKETLAAWLKDNHGVEVHYETLRKYLDERRPHAEA